jgi:type II secretory pathway pseudopilin PulG|tara:strand:+ start:39206 stop:39391 length:186 start_codon:yes stop_codon:yes gene_type:complete
MTTPNWQHHSKKEQKRKLKPQAMRARKEALRHFKKSHIQTSSQRKGSYTIDIDTKSYVHQF